MPCSTVPILKYPCLRFQTPTPQLAIHIPPPSFITNCHGNGKCYGKPTLDKSNHKLGASMVVGIISIAAISITQESTGLMLDSQKGGSVFQNACVACHYGGGNILQPGAGLTTTDLERNGIVTVEDIFNITYYGKGRMPGFGEKCKPKGQCTFGPRLSEEDIRLLAEYVKTQADYGWPKLEQK